jgi:hypothetical protein
LAIHQKCFLPSLLFIGWHRQEWKPQNRQQMELDWFETSSNEPV